VTALIRRAVAGRSQRRSEHLWRCPHRRCFRCSGQAGGAGRLSPVLSVLL